MSLLDHYVIEIRNKKTKQVGYIIEDHKGIQVAEIALEECPRFANKKLLYEYVKKHKLRKSYLSIKPIKMKNALGVGVLEKGQNFFFVICVEGDEYGFIHFDTKNQNYFLSNHLAGVCLWKSKKEVNSFIATLDDKEGTEYYALNVDKLNLDNSFTEKPE